MSNTSRLTLLAFSLLSFCCSASALNEKAYIKITQALQAGDIENAQVLLEKQIHKEKSESEWYKMLDDTYKYTDNTNARIDVLKNGLSVKNINDPQTLNYRLAMALSDAGQYGESIRILKSLKQTAAVKKAISTCTEAEKLRSNPLNCVITPMNDNINTPYDNIWPFIDNSKNHFYTTVVIGKSTVMPKAFDIQEDIFCSQLKDSVWMPTSILQGELRSNENEGACCITADGLYLFFAACNRRDGGGGCEIYYSKFTNGQWSRPKRGEAPLNQLNWQSTPSVSADSKTLYFSAIDNTPSKQNKRSIGNKDIYQCTINYLDNGSISFADVKKLSENINSDGNEISPFISPYNNILYFASDGRGGMGGLDIYYSTRNDYGEWSKAENIGYPINTHRDEFGFVVDVNGEYGYMSCNGLEGGDFWQNKRIVQIPLDVKHRADAPFEDKGVEFTLENIYFDSDKSTLKEESDPYLNKFAEYLTVHPLYTLEINGHTDNTGSEQHNISLSKERAESVAQRLIEKGIDKRRIKTNGFGSAFPKTSNETEEGKAVNRRIEVTVIKK